MKNYKQLLVYAIVGINFPSYALADDYERIKAIFDSAKGMENE